MTAHEAAPEELRVATDEIAAYLQQLHREGAGVLLSGPPGESLWSRIVALDAEADLIGLQLGTDPDGISQGLVAEGEITAIAYLSAIKLQFELEAPVLVSGEQGAVLRSPLPTRLYRFQRRQAFRVQPASSNYPRIVVPGGTEPGHSLRVLDISIGGLALALPGDAMPLPIGQAAHGLTLELDRISGLPVSLLPHHVSAVSAETGAVRQLGCAFIDLDATATRALQVYVDQTQKRRRLLKLDP
jgi:c-di-GMP-binding flagellar brake protein YcgR